MARATIREELGSESPVEATLASRFKKIGPSLGGEVQDGVVWWLTEPAK